MLIAILCGTCTFRFISATLFPAGPLAGNEGEWMIASSPIAFTIIGLVVGGTPTVLGSVLACMAIRLIRRPTRPEATRASEED